MAVIGLAMAIALKKIDPKLAEKEKQDALLTLGKLNSDEWAEYARDQQLDTPLFEVPDFFGTPNINTQIGQFDYDPTEHY